MKHKPFWGVVIAIFLTMNMVVYGRPITKKLAKIDLRIEEKEGALFRNAAEMALYDGHIFIVDNVDHRMLDFLVKNNELRFQRSIGRHGQGPGDLELPIRISIWNGTIAVQDQAGISFFNLAGNFENRFRFFSGGISLLYSNDLIYCATANPARPDLIDVYSKEGKRLLSFCPKTEVINFRYDSVRGMRPVTVEMVIFNGLLLSDDNAVYYLNRRFGTITKFSLSGEKLASGTISPIFGKDGLAKEKENEKLFIKGDFDSFIKNRLIPDYYLFRSARIIGNSIFLLKDQWNFEEKKRDTVLEIMEIDKNKLELLSTYKGTLSETERYLSFDAMVVNAKPDFFVLSIADQGYRVSRYFPE
jgi:hypothetical protein